MKTKLLFLTLLSTIAFYSQTQIGADIDGEAANDRSGYSVSLSSDGNIMAIGAPYNDGNATDSGHCTCLSKQCRRLDSNRYRY